MILKNLKHLRWMGIVAIVAVGIQASALLFFTVDILLDLFHVAHRPVSWTAHEILEITSVLGAIIGGRHDIVVVVCARSRNCPPNAVDYSIFRQLFRIYWVSIHLMGFKRK